MASKARRRVALAQPEWSNLLTEGQLAGVDRQGDEASGASKTPCTRGLEILTEGQLAGVNATISARRPMQQSLSAMAAAFGLLQVEGKPSLVSSHWDARPRPCPPDSVMRAFLDEPAGTPMHAVGVEPPEVSAVGDVCNFGVPGDSEVCRWQLEDARVEAEDEGAWRGEHGLELGDTRTNMTLSQKQEKLCSPPVPTLPFLAPPAEVSCSVPKHSL